MDFLTGRESASNIPLEHGVPQPPAAFKNSPPGSNLRIARQFYQGIKAAAHLRGEAGPTRAAEFNEKGGNRPTPKLLPSLGMNRSNMEFRRGLQWMPSLHQAGGRFND